MTNGWSQMICISQLQAPQARSTIPATRLSKWQGSLLCKLKTYLLHGTESLPIQMVRRCLA